MCTLIFFVQLLLTTGSVCVSFVVEIQVERVKRVLSTQHQARVEIESLYEGEDFSETLTRARFEEVRYHLGICRTLFRRVLSRF